MNTHSRSAVGQTSTIPFAPALRWDQSPVEMLAARIHASVGAHLNGSVLSAITDAFAFTSVTLVWIVQQVTREDADALIDRIRGAADGIGWPTLDDERACNIDCGCAVLDVSSTAAKAKSAGTKVMLDLTMSEPCLIDLKLSSGAAWKQADTAIDAFKVFFHGYLDLSTEGFEAVPLTGQVVGCVDIAGSVNLPEDPEIRVHFDGSVHVGGDLAWSWTGSELCMEQVAPSMIGPPIKRALIPFGVVARSVASPKSFKKRIAFSSSSFLIRSGGAMPSLLLRIRSVATVMSGASAALRTGHRR